jgi:hypothetical protein
MFSVGSGQSINEQLRSLSLKIDRHTSRLGEQPPSDAAPPINRENTVYLQGLLSKLGAAMQDTDVVGDLDREMKYGKIAIPVGVQLSEEQRNLKDSLVLLFRESRGAILSADEQEKNEFESIAKILETSFAELDAEFDRQVDTASDQEIYNHEYARYESHHRKLSATEASAMEEARDKCRNTKKKALGNLKTQCLATASDETADSLPMNVTTAKFFRDLYSETREMIMDKKIPDTVNNE